MLYKIISISIISAVILYYLKTTSNEFFTPVLVVSCILILSLSLGYIVKVLDVFNKIKALTGINEEIFTIIFKIIAVSYLIEFCAGMICDMGFNSLSEKVVFAGKLIILCMVFPIVEQILNILISLL